MILSLVPELNHAGSGSIVIGDRDSEALTPIGIVRATGTGVVMVGDVALDAEKTDELIKALQFARYAQRKWLDRQSGRSGYRVDRGPNGEVFCEHGGIRGQLRLKRFKARTEMCCACHAMVWSLWVPVHKPWNRCHEVAAALCCECLPKCETVRRGIRIVEGEDA